MWMACLDFALVYALIHGFYKACFLTLLISNTFFFYLLFLGTYMSPHLRSVRERIRIDGKKLNKEDFTNYCFEVYERLKKAEAANPGMVGFANY